MVQRRPGPVDGRDENHGQAPEVACRRERAEAYVASRGMDSNAGRYRDAWKDDRLRPGHVRRGERDGLGRSQTKAIRRTEMDVKRTRARPGYRVLRQAILPSLRMERRCDGPR